MAVVMHDWLRAVIYTGIVCSVLMMITPAGRVKKVLTILCGIAMCFAVISPLSGIDFTSYSQAMAQNRLDAENTPEMGLSTAKI